jgi:hypothetical protein
VFGTLVHNDGTRVYVRSFASGDRLAGYPFSAIKSWGRVVASFRP